MSDIPAGFVVKNGHIAPDKCPNCGAPHKLSDNDDYHEYKCRSFLWRGILNKESKCNDRAEAIAELRADLERATKERDELKAKWDETVNEIWTSELQSQIHTARAQRDRAMAFIRHKVMCNFYDTEGDRECDCGYRELMEEIAKEKEGR